MPFRSQETLQQWLAEFRETQHAPRGLLEVVPRDWTDGEEDAGLVMVRLSDTVATAYLQPVGAGNPAWLVSFEARERDIDLTAPQLHSLATELSVAASLCEYLELKSRDYLATHNQSQ